jgi:hypothetical protein
MATAMIPSANRSQTDVLTTRLSPAHDTSFVLEIDVTENGVGSGVARCLVGVDRGRARGPAKALARGGQGLACDAPKRMSWVKLGRKSRGSLSLLPGSRTEV